MFDFLRRVKIKTNSGKAVQLPPQAGAFTAGVVRPFSIMMSLSTALRLSAFWALSGRTAKILSTLPLRVYRRTRDGKRELVPDHQASWIWNVNANPVWPGPRLVEVLFHGATVFGSGYVELVKYTRGDVAELWNLAPPLMTPQWIPLSDGSQRFVYRYQNPGGGQVDFRPNEILHFSGPGLGFVGDSLIDVCGCTLAEAKAISDFTLAWYSRSGQLGGVLKSDKMLNAEKRKEYEESFRQVYTGAANAGQVIMLDGGLTFEPLNTTIKAADLTGQKNGVLLDMARALDLPMPLIQHQVGAQGYGTNLQVLVDGFVKFSLSRWITLINAELTRKLFPLQGNLYYAELDTSTLQRGDQLTRANAGKIFIDSGVKTRNEVRVEEGLNTLDQKGMDTCSVGSTGPKTPADLDFEVVQETPEDENAESVDPADETDDDDDEDMEE